MSSLWLSANDIFKNIDIKHELNYNLDADVCIIGAGILGVTCGYYLSKLGFKVIILEKDFITEINKVYSITDKLFSMWINKIYGNYPII